MLRRRTIEIIFSIAFALSILITAFYIPYYNDSFFKSNFQVNGAYQELGMDEANEIYEDLREYLDEDYFGHNRMHLLSEFTENEKSHLADVKKIIDWLRILYYILLVAVIASLILIITYYKKEIHYSSGTVLMHAGIGLISSIMLMSILSLLDFGSFWTGFHHIFFPQGNWTFSSDSLLIILFPQEFFQGFVRKFAIYSAVFGIISILSGIFLRNYHSRS